MPRTYRQRPTQAQADALGTPSVAPAHPPPFASAVAPHPVRECPGALVLLGECGGALSTPETGAYALAGFLVAASSPTNASVRQNGPMIDRIIARLLSTRWLMRLPIPIYRAGLGRLLGPRLLMIEHLGRSSGEPRYVVVEIVEREGRALRVASGFGTKAQWYRNLRANGVAYVSTGGVRRERVAVKLLDDEESAVVLARYRENHADAWEKLKGAMDLAQGGEARIPVVEFTPRA